MFQQPLTLRRIVAAGMPSASAPRRRTSLFSFGATSHGVIFRRRSTRSNHGARSASLKPAMPNVRDQCVNVVGGVRKLDVQLTVVPPPTQRPCNMLIALSRVLRAADS